MGSGIWGTTGGDRWGTVQLLPPPTPRLALCPPLQEPLTSLDPPVDLPKSTDGPGTSDDAVLLDDGSWPTLGEAAAGAPKNWEFVGPQTPPLVADGDRVPAGGDAADVEAWELLEEEDEDEQADHDGGGAVEEDGSEDWFLTSAR